MCELCVLYSLLQVPVRVQVGLTQSHCEGNSSATVHVRSYCATVGKIDDLTVRCDDSVDGDGARLCHTTPLQVRKVAVRSDRALVMSWMMMILGRL